ncbi:Strongly-conserved Zn-finger binding protein (TFIIIA) [Bachmanniomyces sp. S44760]|nr:Strongly-conserved Zn-finger binding protein (TFIIIA) [Bachmanniomyces sp. S44760]
MDTSPATSGSSGSDDEKDDSEAPTPATPVSSKGSPRFPSELKNHHCPHPSCLKSFNRPARLSEHLRSHTNERIHVCPHAPCTKDFLRQTHLKHHIKSAHSDIRDYSCEHNGCDKKFATATRLRRHIAAHEGREKYKCSIAECGQTFRKHGTLQKHISVVHEGKQPFYCDKWVENGQLCGVGFETAGKLKTHEARAHGGNRYCCVVCSHNTQDDIPQDRDEDQEVGFPTYAAFQEHNKLVHPPTCDNCGFQCATSKELTRHMDILHGLQDVSERQRFNCTEPSCGRGFTSKGNLLLHITTVHHGKRGFICGTFDISKLNNVKSWLGDDACGKDFTTKGNLEEHVRTVHMRLPASRRPTKRSTASVQNAKPECCKKEFSAIARLTGSAYTESDRSITCPQSGCRHLFVREYDLGVHLRSRHGLADFEIQQLRDKNHNGPEGQGPKNVNEEEERDYLEAQMALDEQFEYSARMRDGPLVTAADSIGDELEEASARNDRFWIGHEEAVDIDMQDYDQWDRSQTQVQRLIKEEDHRMGDGKAPNAIDPTLR